MCAMREAKLNHSEDQKIYRNQILTLGDLEDFKTELYGKLTSLFNGNSGWVANQWLRSPEARKMLGISPGTLQNLRVTRKLAFSKIGGIVYYKYDDVVQLLEDNRIAKEEGNE